MNIKNNGIEYNVNLIQNPRYQYIEIEKNGKIWERELKDNKFIFKNCIYDIKLPLLKGGFYAIKNIRKIN